MSGLRYGRPAPTPAHTPRCEVAWPLELDAPPHEHRTPTGAEYLVFWEEKGFRASSRSTPHSFLCCEEHAQAAQAWGKTHARVYKLLLVEEPEQ